MRTREVREVETISCDGCGAELDGPGYDVSLVLGAGPAGGTRVSFEWWSRGDWCEDCGRRLLAGLVAALPVPERCSPTFADQAAAVAVERALFSAAPDPSWED